MVPLVPEKLPDLSSTRVFIGAGAFDPIVATSESKELATLLRNAGADVTIRFFQTGHELTANDLDAARQWLGKLK
jgi:phospholipase/carboxylesterase